MFSEKDRKTVLSIREMFSKDGNMPEYREKSNAIYLEINGKIDTHNIVITCCNYVLVILSARGVDAHNCSEESFKYVLDLNLGITMGSFGYSLEGECFIYKLNVPLHEKPEKEFIKNLTTFTIKVLDYYVPEILSHIHENKNGNEEKRSPAYH